MIWIDDPTHPHFVHLLNPVYDFPIPVYDFPIPETLSGSNGGRGGVEQEVTKTVLHAIWIVF